MKAKGKAIAVIVAATVLILMIVLIVVEESNGGYLYIRNNTGRNIEDITISFYDELQEMTVDYLYSGNIEAGKSVDYSYKDDGGFYYFSGMSCTCDIEVTFADGETMYIEDGQFTSDFKGNFELKFYEDDGQLMLTTKAYEGLFKSTHGTLMDSDFALYPEDGDWDYIY